MIFVLRNILMLKKFFLALGLVLAVALSAYAGNETATEKPKVEEPYIVGKPADGIFRIVVLGDSLADGLYQGLTQINKDDDRFVTTKKSKVNTGLVRVDRYDWTRGAKKIARSKDYQIAVVLLGLNDLQSFREKGKAYHFQTDGWVERYRSKVEEMMQDLKSAGMAVYWTGIPITSPKRYQEEYLYLNGFYKEAAAKVGVRYVDTWTALADAKGEYSPFWKGEDGKLKEIRNRDGVHFTPEGYQIFAGIVNDTVMADLKGLLDDPVNKTD